MNNIQALIGRRISERRNELRISQSELAVRLGKSLRTVQKYESGEIDMPVSILESISDVMNTSMGYLIGADEDEKEIKKIKHDLHRAKECIKSIKNSSYNYRMSRAEDLKHYVYKIARLVFDFEHGEQESD